MKTLLILIFVNMLIYNIAEPKIINVPADQPTIQAGINAATTGDTVLVADGTYIGEGNKDITFSGKEIVVRSENGPQNCVIDCENSKMAIAFVFNSSETANCIVEGFTIRNGDLGFWVYANSSPTIAKNIIEECFVGIYCSSDAAPFIIGNIIRNNNNYGPYPENGGGISVSWSAPTIKNNIIYKNSSAKGGGIYCFNSPSAKIINNTIIGNSAIGSSAADGDGSPILHCEYDRHNRPDVCFVEETQLGFGGGIYIENSSAEIMNNIIAFSKESSESSGLSHWYYTDLFMRYNYKGALLKSVNYYYGFKNNGDSGDIHLSGCGVDTTFTIQSGERYWIETTSFVSGSGDGGGIDLTIRMDKDSLKLKVTLELYPGHFGGCYSLYNTTLQSYGAAQDGVAQGGMCGAGIIAIGDSIFPNITYNDIYGNEGGNYFIKAIDSTYEVNLTGIDGNISLDPLIEPPNYLLSGPSPCIDAGNPDVSYNDKTIPPGKGTVRCDIGAFGGPFNDYVDEFATDVQNKKSVARPDKFYLAQNFPNPFNPITTITYQLPQKCRISISLFNILGDKVKTLYSGIQTAGIHKLKLDAHDLPSGLYFYLMKTNTSILSRKCILLK